MIARLAILCPGQGGQHPGMFDLARGDPALAGAIASWALPEEDDSFANRHAQPLVVGAGCAIWEALRARIPVPHAVAGYSVGEVTALAVAGMLAPKDAVRLAAERARLMDACTDPATPQGLAAVSGLVRADLMAIVATAGTGHGHAPAHVAIENATDQFILGGAVEMLGQVQPLLEQAGARVQRLPVTVASHTPWMQPAVAPLTRFLETMEFSPPAVRLLSGISGAPMADASAAITGLALQTAQTVHWSACMDALSEASVTAALELGPGAALSNMLAARHPGIACRSASEFRTLDGIVRWVERLSG